MKNPKIEEGEEVEAEAKTFSTRIPDDREALLEFMDQRAQSIQGLKDQISILDRKLAEERKLMADAEAKFLQIDSVGNGTFSSSKSKMPGKTGSLLGISEFWTKGNTSKPATETSTSNSRSEMESLKVPSIILPPSFKRRAPAPVRAEMTETTQCQSMATRDYKNPKEDTIGHEAKRSRSIPDEVVRDTQERDNKAQTIATRDYNVPKVDKSGSVVKRVIRESQGRDNVAQPMATSDYNVPKEERSGLEAKRSRSIPNEVVWVEEDGDNPTPAQARHNHNNKDLAKPKIRVSSNISQQGQQEKPEFRGHNELIALIGRSSLRPTIEGRTVGMQPSYHTKRIRSLALSPSHRELFATSALDGAVHFWKLQSDRSKAALFKTVNRVSVDQKKWAEDIAWHPHKSALFSVYTADEGHSQISAIYLNEAGGGCVSKFLEDRPHSKGLINRIMFTPWDDPCFMDQLNLVSKIHDQLYEVLRIVDVNSSEQSDLSESFFMPQEMDMEENIRASLAGMESIFELAKVVSGKAQVLVEEKSHELKNLNETVGQLVKEKEHIGTLLRSALSKRMITEQPSQKRELFQAAENGLRDVGIDSKFTKLLKDGKVQESRSDNTDDHSTEENEIYSLASTLENIVKASQLEIAELQHLLAESREETGSLRKQLDAQTKELNQRMRQIEELKEKERIAHENVEGLMTDIAAAEEEITRWKVAAEQEAAAGGAVEQDFTSQLSLLKEELEEAKQTIVESEKKLKFKEETAAAAIGARDAAERSLRLADNRATKLRERIQELNRKIEELETHRDMNTSNRARYVCWPWQLLGIDFVGGRRIESEQENANEMELAEPLL